MAVAVAPYDRRKKGEPYAESKAVRDRSDPFEALYRRAGLREPIIMDSTEKGPLSRGGGQESDSWWLLAIA